jgi:hypothetical protein
MMGHPAVARKHKSRLTQGAAAVAAAFTATGQLVAADGQVLAVLAGSSGCDNGAPCSGQETQE